LAWDKPDPGGQVTTVLELRTIADGGDDRRGGLRADALNLGDALAGFVATEHRVNLHPDGSGEAVLRLIDIRSDETSDSLAERDCRIMMSSFEQEGVKDFEDNEFEQVPTIEKRVVELVKAGKNDEARQYVTSCTNDYAYAAMKRWEDMKSTMWLIVSRGY